MLRRLWLDLKSKRHRLTFLASSSLTILLMRRRRVVVAVRTDTTRTKPSEPGKTSTTRTSGHRVGDVGFRRIRTMSLTLIDD